MTSARRKLRELLDQEEVVYAPGVWDGLSALLATQAGFNALCSSGFAISASLGMPDAELYSMSENVERVREITEASDLPVIADIDTGYGNAVNVMRTVRQFEKAGVAAVFMEDQLAPKRCPICVGDPVPLVSLEEGAGKIRAAADAKDDEDFLIIARVDATGKEAIERAHAYVDAGAEMVMPVSKTFSSLDEWAECHQEIGVPLVASLTANTWVEEKFDHQGMVDAGIKIGFLPTQVLFGAVTGMRSVLQRLQAGDEPHHAVSADNISHFEFIKLIGFPEVEALQEKYLPAELPGA